MLEKYLDENGLSCPKCDKLLIIFPDPHKEVETRYVTRGCNICKTVYQERYKLKTLIELVIITSDATRIEHKIGD